MNRPLIVVIASGLAMAPALAQPCGNPWTLSPASGPSSRTNAAMAYDSGRGRIILFGGSTSPGLLGDTWEWAATGPSGGGTWTLRSTTGPSPRVYAGLAYDSLRHKTVLFGGQPTGFSYSSETWEWDGVAWAQMSPAASPPAMMAYMMQYDVSRQRTILVPTTGAVNATFEYDGTTWTHVFDSPPIPGSVINTSLAYDAARATMVLTGQFYSVGFSGSGTFERTASGWILRNGNQTPGSIGSAPTTYDPVRQRVILIDSTAYSNTLGIWSWDGTNARWEAVTTSGPTPLAGRSAAYDAAGGQLVLFGGTQTWLTRSDLRDGPTVNEIGPRSMVFALMGPPFTLNADSTGTSPVSYRWRLNRVELSDAGVFSGTGTAHLTVDPTDVVYTGYYDALVTDACGTTIRPATIVQVSCYPNCDNSTSNPILNAEDFQCFLNMYASNQSYANCDHSTAPPVLNTNDFQCFMNKYAAGCP